MSLADDFDLANQLSERLMRETVRMYYGIPGSFNTLETDDELRARILYVADATQEILTAKGQALDDLAERFGLKRRRS